MCLDRGQALRRSAEGTAQSCSGGGHFARGRCVLVSFFASWMPKTSTTVRYSSIQVIYEMVASSLRTACLPTKHLPLVQRSSNIDDWTRSMEKHHEQAGSCKYFFFPNNGAYQAINERCGWLQLSRGVAEWFPGR